MIYRKFKVILKKIDSLFFYFLTLLFSFFGKQYTEEIHIEIVRFVKFGCVGVSNTAVSYVLYLFFLWIFRKNGTFLNRSYLIAQWISYVLSILWSFFLNNYFVFNQDKEKRVWWKTLLKTYMAYSFTGIFLNSILLVFWVEILHIDEMIAPIINLIINIPINYLINRLWAYKI